MVCNLWAPTSVHASDLSRQRANSHWLENHGHACQRSQHRYCESWVRNQEEPLQQHHNDILPVAKTEGTRWNVPSTVQRRCEKAFAERKERAFTNPCYGCWGTCKSHSASLGLRDSSAHHPHACIVARKSTLIDPTKPSLRISSGVKRATKHYYETSNGYLRSSCCCEFLRNFNWVEKEFRYGSRSYCSFSCKCDSQSKQTINCRLSQLSQC